MTPLSRFARLLGIRDDQAEDALYSERAARHVLSRRSFFGVSAAMAAGTVWSFLWETHPTDPILDAWGNTLRITRMPGEPDELLRGRLRAKLEAVSALSRDRLLYGFSAHYEDGYGNIVRVNPSALKHHPLGWMKVLS